LKFKRSLLAASFAAALAMIVPSLRPEARAAQTPAPPSTKPAGSRTDQVRGFSIQLFDSTEAGAQRYLAAIDELADMGCTWLNFSIAARQDNVHSEEIARNWLTIPSQPNLMRIFRKAKSRNIGVMLMPIVLLNNAGSKDWRGVISPPNWDDWFASYSQYILEMADIANAGKVDIFCVGSELLSTEPFRDRWVELIGQIRARFSYPIKLTYSANWDHYDPEQGGPKFWDQLDYIGMNNYNELGDKPGIPVSQLVKAWEPIKDKVLKFATKEKKPFFFTEVGWHNLDNTIKEPWNYVADGKIDLTEQLHAYQSFVQVWEPVPHDEFMGAFVWEWCPGSNGDKNKGSYSLQGTDALKVVQQWMKDP
jgi:hypothetical protein